MKFLAAIRSGRAGDTTGVVLAGVAVWVAWTAPALTSGDLDAGTRGGAASFPFAFEANRGQADAGYPFIANGRGCSFLLSPETAVIALARSDAAGLLPERREAGRETRVTVRTVELRWLGANPRARAEGMDALPGRVNYLIGNNPAAWQTAVPTFGKVRFRDVYAGVDVIYYGRDRQLEFDFIVSPGANVASLAFEVNGAESVRVEADGDLVMRVGGRELRQHRPVAYQDVDGRRKEVESRYQLAAANRVELRLGWYDRTHTLVIDPVFSYATYFGGSVDEVAWDVAVQPGTANAFIAGRTTSPQLAAAVHAARTNRAYAGGSTAGGDAFVAKLSSNGTSVLWMTYLGGSSHDGALALAVDAAGCAFVTGYTASPDFPVAGSLRTNIHGTIVGGGYETDGFITKLDPDGALASDGAYSAFLGGDKLDQGVGVAVDGVGRAWITGLTESTNLAVTTNALQPVLGGAQDAFVARINAAGSELEYLTYLGGTHTDRGEGIAVDMAGNAWVTGYTHSTNFWRTNGLLGIGAIQPQINNPLPTPITNAVNTLADAFVTKLLPDGALGFSTFLGGVGNEYGFRIVTDAAGDAYVTGSTASETFPASTTNLAGTVWTNQAGANVFVTKIAADGGTNWLYSVSFGGTADDVGWDLAVNGSGEVIVAGATTSANFPVLTNVVPPGGSVTNHGGKDAFVVGVNADGTALTYSFYHGGRGSETARGLDLDVLGNLYLAGDTSSTNLFVRNALQPAFAGGTSDGFMAKLLVPQVLSIARSGEAVVVQWPALAEEFVLQTSANPGNSVWQTVPQPQTVAGGLGTVTLDATNAAAFFRLGTP